jgi:hypothetical protein
MSKVKEIVRIRKYEQNGEEKTAFDPIGILVTKDNGKMSVKLHMLDDWFPVVEKQKKSEGQKPDENTEIEPF